MIESCTCCRVGFSCPEGAYIVPLNFAFVSGSPDRFYFHGAHEGRKAELIRTAPRVGFTFTDEQAQRAAVFRLDVAQLTCKEHL